jgi:hypothetical protein
MSLTSAPTASMTPAPSRPRTVGYENSRVREQSGTRTVGYENSRVREQSGTWESSCRKPCHPSGSVFESYFARSGGNYICFQSSGFKAMALSRTTTSSEAGVGLGILTISKGPPCFTSGTLVPVGAAIVVDCRRQNL